MFQDSRLLPWKRVIDNVGLGLSGDWQAPGAARRWPPSAWATAPHEWPAALSGGQKQRVALARALIHQPRLLLLDEPLGALDALTRIEMQQLIERLWQQHGFTVLLVTHDVAEAVAVADRVILIEDGRIGLDLAVDLPRPRPARLGAPGRAGSRGARTACWRCRPLPAAARTRFTPADATALGPVVSQRAASPQPGGYPGAVPTITRSASGLVEPERSNTMTIKAINVRNQFKGTIKEIVIGDVLSEIDVQTAAGIVTSVITTRSVRELELRVGSEVIAFVKSTEVSIAKL